MGTTVIDKLRIQGKSAPRITFDSNVPLRRHAASSAGTDGAIYGAPLIYPRSLRRSPLTSSEGHQRPALVLIPDPGQQVNSSLLKNGGSKSLASNSAPSSCSSTAASRRYDFLQRVQIANKGLTTGDTSGGMHGSSPTPRNENSHADDGGMMSEVTVTDIIACTSDPVTSGASNIGNNNIDNNCNVARAYSQNGGASFLPNIQFLLRGRTVPQGEDETTAGIASVGASNITKNNSSRSTQYTNNNGVYLPHQRVGHYKTSAKEVYRARHRPEIQTLYPLDPRHASSAYRAIRTSDSFDSHGPGSSGNNHHHHNNGNAMSSSASANNGPAYFYLGPPMAANQSSKPTSNEMMMMLKHPKMYNVQQALENNELSVSAAPMEKAGSNYRRGGQFIEDFSLTGQPLSTPRLLQQVDYEMDDMDMAVGHYGYGYFPGHPAVGANLTQDIHGRGGLGTPTTSVGPRRHRGGGGGGGSGNLGPRAVSRESSSLAAPPAPPSSSAAVIDPDLLQQCLHVHQTQGANNGEGLATHGDASSRSEHEMKLKHFTNYVRKDDSSINGGHHHTNGNKTKAANHVAPKPGNRYVFNSVDSYIHFNKIYPKTEADVRQAKTSGSNSTNLSINGTNGNPLKTSNAKKNFAPRIPQVDGFSPHCTETVLLKMMFGMNRPAAPSVRSGARYSDIAVHADLDEFVVLGSSTATTASRSTSVASKKFFSSGNSGKNVNSNTSKNRKGKDNTGKSDMRNSITDIHKEVEEIDTDLGNQDGEGEGEGRQDTDDVDGHGRSPQQQSGGDAPQDEIDAENEGGERLKADNHEASAEDRNDGEEGDGEENQIIRAPSATGAERSPSRIEVDLKNALDQVYSEEAQPIEDDAKSDSALL